MKKLVVADAARADLREIARATERGWGAAQSRRYMNAIRDRFTQLRSFPSLGASRSELAAGYRSVPCGRHVIFYREAAETIEVVRVLHERMDVHRHFESAEHEAVRPRPTRTASRRRPPK